MKKTLFVFLLIACVAGAAYIDVIDPVKERLRDGDTIAFGVAGPGQTIEVIAEKEVGEGGKFGTGGQWDVMVAEVPEGWDAESSLIYEDPMRTKIKVAPNAADGEYELVLTAIDELNADQLGNITYSAKVNVSRDVLNVDVTPLSRTVGAYQPAEYTVFITNKGAASDVFEISAGGVPTWTFRKSVFVAHGTTKAVEYEVASGEEKEFVVLIDVTSHSSELINEQESVNMRVKTGLLEDYRATANGLLIFPIIEQPIYALIGLLSNLI